MNVGILFDLDGTLLDTLEDLHDSVNVALGSFGFPARTLEEVRQFVGNGAEQLIRLAVPAETAPSLVPQVLGAFRQHYATNCRNKTRPYPGIMDALAELGREYPIAIVSNKPDSAVKELCELYFPGVYALGESADCPRKPAPDMVYKAMTAIGVDRCIYVGDSEVDVRTARNAAVPCLSVLWGFRDRDVMEKEGAEYFCETGETLPSAIWKITEKL